MIEILKQKYNYYWVRYADVNVGDTFVDDNGNVYIKIPWVIHVENKTIGNKEFSIEEKDYNCVSLRDGRITGFPAEAPVRLVDCELYWKFRGADKCEECED